MSKKKSNKAIKIFAIVFSLTIILTSLQCFMLPTSAEGAEIKNIEPVILANVGDKISLSGYSVEFSDGSIEDNITWKYNGSEISAFDVTEAKVYPLVAESSGKTQNIYLVAKGKDDSEYVLLYEDFTDENAIDGWTKIVSNDNVYTVNDGKLQINGLISGVNNPRLYLPSWLSDFGNYRIDTVATQVENTDASRWISVIFRAENAGTTGTPYYHMAIRNNMKAAASSTTGGIECCSFTNKWNYYKSASYTESINSNYFTYSVLVKDETVQYQIDDNIVIHLDELPDISDDKRGGIGLQANSSKLLVDSIKVTVLTDKPGYTEPEIPQKLQFVKNPESNILNTPTNIAIIDSLETLEGLEEGSPSNALMYIDDSLNVNTKDGANITTVEKAFDYLGKSIIPAFYVNDKTTVDKLAVFLKEKEFEDALVISADTEVAGYVFEKYKILRNAVDFSSLAAEKPSDEKLLEIRGITRTAKSLIAILPMEYANADTVYYLQSLGVTVWIKNDNLTSDTTVAQMITSGATGLITNDYNIVASAFKKLFEPNTITKTSLIIGHRGNPTMAPENSLSGYLKAIENGADVVETDVYLSKDGHVVIMHDGTMKRTTTYTGSTSITQMTLEEIKQYNLWADGNKFKNDYPEEKVPTLKELFEALKDKDTKIFLEIKDGNSNIIKPIVDLIDEYNYEDRVFVICFTAGQLINMQKSLPTMGTGFLMGGSISDTTTEEKLHDTLYQNYKQFHACYSTFNPGYRQFTGDFMAALRHRGITIWPWTYTLSSATDFNNSFLAGVDGITTNDAQYSKDMVKKLVASTNTFNIELEGTSTFSIDKITYGGDTSDILEDENTFITFIEGGDLITIESGNIKAEKEGKASFMVGYKTKTAGGQEYVLYTQPFTVNVFTPESESESEFPTKIVLIIAAVVLAILALLIMIVPKKKAK